jgi:GH43 family beta-xylosidase
MKNIQQIKVPWAIEIKWKVITLVKATNLFQWSVIVFQGTLLQNVIKISHKVFVCYIKSIMNSMV